MRTRLGFCSSLLSNLRREGWTPPSTSLSRLGRKKKKQTKFTFMYRPACRIIHTGGLSTASPRRARSISGSEEEPCFCFREGRGREGKKDRGDKDREESAAVGGGAAASAKKERGESVVASAFKINRRLARPLRDLVFAFLPPQRSRKTLWYPSACQSSSSLPVTEPKSWFREPRENVDARQKKVSIK